MRASKWLDKGKDRLDGIVRLVLRVVGGSCYLLFDMKIKVICATFLGRLTIATSEQFRISALCLSISLTNRHTFVNADIAQVAIENGLQPKRRRLYHMQE